MGAPTRQRGDEGAEADRLGHLREGAQHDPRVQVVQPGLELQVVPEEHAIPADALGVARPPDDGGGVGERGKARAIPHDVTLVSPAQRGLRGR